MKTIVLEHPLLQHKLSILRDKNTGTKEFREIVGEIATIMCYEATRDAELRDVEVETPLTTTVQKRLDEKFFKTYFDNSYNCLYPFFSTRVRS